MSGQGQYDLSSLLAARRGTAWVVDAFEKSVHDLTIEAWAALLMRLQPDEYQEPPPPPEPSRAITRAAKVEVMASREAAGFGLYHQGDLDLEDCERVGFDAFRLRNGRVKIRGVKGG